MMRALRTIIEYTIVAVIAVGMARLGYGLMGWYDGDRHFIEDRELGWTLGYSAVFVVTWFWLYRMCRRLHWLVLPIMGLFSPIIGVLLFTIPYLFVPYLILCEFAVVIFPVGMACGLVVSLCTLPFRPREVWARNAS